MTAMSEFIKPAHKAVARSIGYALTTGDSDGWGMFTLRHDRDAVLEWARSHEVK